MKEVKEILPPQKDSLETKEQRDVMTQIAAANIMSATTSYCMERRMLADIPIDDENCNAFMRLYQERKGECDLHNIRWIQVKQVGKNNSSPERCFAALTNILHACSIPRTRTLFLVTGEDKQFSLYLGLYIRPGQKLGVVENAVREISSFCEVSWPGTRCQVVKDVEKTSLVGFEKGYYDKAYALTGIPSTNLGDNDYPSTIEYLLGGCKPKGKIAYLVVAEPVSETEINQMMYTCEEISGQAKSFESFEISTSTQQGFSESLTESESTTTGATVSDGKSQKGKLATALAIGGLAAVAGIAFLPGVAVFGAAAGMSQLVTGGLIMGGMSQLASLFPQHTHTESRSEQHTTSHTETKGFSSSYGNSLGRTLVNGHMEAIAEQMAMHHKRYEGGRAKGMWKVGCYLFTDDDNASSHIQLKSLLSGCKSHLEPIRTHDISMFLDEERRKGLKAFLDPPSLVIWKYDGSDEKGEKFIHPMGEKSSHLTTILTTDELTSMINFPMHSVPGISVVDVIPDFSLSPQNLSSNIPILEIGSLIYSGSQSSVSIGLPLNTLSRHALVCGVNGSGKTNTVMKVLNGLLQEKCPFLVIEPAKTEYVDWALEYNKTITDQSKKIKVFIPGCEKYRKGEYRPPKLKMNPFEVIRMEGADAHLLMHIDRLKASMASAFPMQDVIPVIMERLIYELYREKGIISCDGEIRMDNPDFPSFTDVNEDFFKDLMSNLGYARENTQNISAALRTRIHTMKQGWKKELLCNEELAGVTWEELFGSPVIINLSYAGDDQDKAFIMSMLLQFLYEYRVAEAEMGKASYTENVCRHLVVVEEAHRVMAHNDNPESPQYKAGLMISNFLSEVRAYGQGMMIVDQIPTRLIDDAIKNTNIKIIHRIVAADDADAMGDSIGLSSDQKRAISKLSVGQAVLSGLNSADINNSSYADVYLAKIDNTK